MKRRAVRPVQRPVQQTPRAAVRAASAAGIRRAVDLRALQRAAGNRVAREVARGTPGGAPVAVQRSLTVGAANDTHEREADAVARDVVQGLREPVQRMELPEEEELQMKHDPVQRVEALEEEELQMKRDPVHRRPVPEVGLEGGQTSAATAQAIQAASGGGQALPLLLRQSMEGAFGADFSGVRVHDDQQADGLNQSLQARAFTQGQDIFFAEGEYQPSSSGGQETLAHELTHVVQQGAGGTSKPRQQA